MSGFRRFRSRVAFGLVVALFAAEVPAVASAAEEPAPDVGVVSPVPVVGPGEDALPLWEREVPASEVVGDAPSFDRSAAVEVSRAVDRVVWRNPDGSFTARVYGGPVNFRDEQGRWRGIDTRLVDDGEGGFVNVAGPFGVRFDESGDAAGLVSLRDGDVSLSFGFDGVGSAERPVALARQAGSRAEVAGGDARDVMRYAAVLPGARLEYQVGADRLKEMVVLDRPLPEGAGSTFRFPLRTEGLVPSLEGDGSVVFRDGAGEVRFTVPAGVAFDSSRLAENFGLAASTPVTTSLDQQPGGGWVLSLAVDERWLADPARVYPVYVDPSYVVSKNASDDATVLVQAPDENYNGAGQYDSGCGCYYARVGYSWPGVNWYSYAHYSGLDWFDGKDVISATWKGYAYQTNAAPTAFTLRPINGSWSANSVTYDTRPSVRAESASGSVTANGQWVSRSITTWVQNWADDTWANYGIRIHGPADDYIWWAAQEQTDKKSYVEVTYNSYPNVPTNLAPASGSWTGDSTPELRAKVSDPDGGQVRGKFAVSTACLGTAVAYGWSSYGASGSTAAWSPSSALADGTYYWWVQAGDSALYGPKSSCAVIKVDTAAPGSAPGVSSSTWTEDAWNTATSGTFTFTNGGVGDVVGWQWGIDVGDVPTNYTTSATVNVTPGAGWHDLAVRSKDAAGNASPVTHYKFGSQSGAIVGMGDGDITQKHFVFTVEGTSSFDGVGLLWRRSEAEAWQGVPDGDVRFKSSGQPIGSWPVTISGSGPVRTSEELVWDVAATAGGVDGPIQVFGWFTIGGQLGSGTTQPVTAQLDQASFGGQTAAAGPGSVDLITGNMTLSASDASMGAVGVSRTFQSRDPNATGSVFGPGWTSSLTANGFVSLHDGTDFVNVTLTDGSIMSFRTQADGSYEPQPDAVGATLAKTGNDFTLTTLDGVVVTFSLPSGGTDYLPVKVDPPAASDDTNMAWEVVGSIVRPTRTTAPAPSGVDCTTAPLTTRGCQSLTFEYATSTTATGTSEPDWGDYTGRLERVNVVVWDPDANPATMVTIAAAEYLYDSDGRLRAAWDPQISPALKTTYGYDSNGHVTSVTPPGQEPWEFTYQPLTGEPASTGRLRTVERSNLQSGETVTTFVYEVPVTGSGAPYDLAPGEVERWAQTVAPTDATAVFPPDQIPSGNPPSSYEYATVYYMDANGRQTNAAQPGGGITTTSYDQHGNVIAELSAQNRQRALDWGQNAYQEMLFAISLSQRSVYDAEGIDVVDEYGPARDVDIDGTTVRAWPHTHYTYDENNPGTDPAHLVTTVTFGAAPLAGGTDQDVRVTRYEYAFDIDGDQTVEPEEQYGWELGTPLRTIVDPGASPHLNLITTTLYDPTTGELTERRLPAGPNGGTAHSTRHISWVAGTTHPSGDTYCVNKPEWAGLPCKDFPAAQPGTAGMPDLPVTVHSKYNRYGRPTETLEIVGSFQDVRTTTAIYDTAARPLTHSVTTYYDGTAIPTVTNAYSTTTGLPTTTTDGSTTITRGYDALGRMTSYTDADGNTSTYTYDTAGRPATIDDGKGTQTISYNQNGERRGVPTTITDSVAGAFTATYDLDGELTTQAYPGGLTATYSYDEAGQARRLDYTKSSEIWLTFDVEPSIHGQWADHTSTLSSQRYSYDAGSRLIGVEDTVGGAGCTVRLYAFDADTNRTSLTTRDPNPDLTCATSGGTTVNRTYDAADRATLTGYSYDRFGRTTTIPAADSPTGNETTIGYYVNDLAHTLTAGGATSTFSLDPNRRYRNWAQSTDNQTHTNHYTGDTDTPAWTTDNTTGTNWTRYVAGFTGLAATHTQASGSVALQLVNLHGDIVANVSPNDTTFDPNTQAFETTEYGQDRSGTERRYQYLGRHQRQNDTNSAITLMGIRSYNPKSGRFTSIDSVVDGSANPYDYVGSDPLSRTDLDGRFWLFKAGKWAIRCWWNCTLYVTRQATRQLHDHWHSLGHNLFLTWMSVVGCSGPHALLCGLVFAFGTWKVGNELSKAVKNNACFIIKDLGWPSTSNSKFCHNYEYRR